MSYWSLIIYGLAALWAVQGLLNLMASHRQRRFAELQRAELARRQAEAAQQQERDERLPGLKSKPDPQPAKAA